MEYFLYLLASMFLGAIQPIQIAINSQLRGILGNPVLAAIVNFGVGLTALTTIALVSRVQLPAMSAVTSAPWYIWIGGLLGATIVAVGTVVTARLGSLAPVAFGIAGQLVFALVIDHFGWFGLPVRSIGVNRIIGVSLLLGGLFFIQRS